MEYLIVTGVQMGIILGFYFVHKWDLKKLEKKYLNK